MREGGALLRLSGDDTVTVVAGDVEEEGDTDGPGRTARFGNLGDQVTLEGGVVADGAGSLYVVDYDRIRKVQLPGAGAGERSPAPQTAGGGAAAAVPTTVEGDVLVSTLPLQAPGDIQALAFDGGGGSSIGSSSLVFATWNALYRLPLGDPTAAPSLLAERPTGGAAALDIRDIVLDGAGTMYVNSTDDDNTTSVWRVAADGTLTSIAEGLKGSLSHLAILGKDRLLLPELFKQAAAVVEAGVSPGTVVGLLLWAEARGPAFSELLSRLKAWYLANHEAVLQEAEEGMKQLAAQCPSLMVELMRGLSSRPAKRPRATEEQPARAARVALAGGAGVVRAGPAAGIPRPSGDSQGVVTRALPGARPGDAASTQTLVACGLGELRPLIGADAHSGLELGPPLQLYADPAARDNGEPAAARRPYAPVEGLTDPVWDPYSSAVYMREGCALLRLSGDDTVTVVAGEMAEEGDTDGPGRTARFADHGDVTIKGFVVTDGAGSLYVADRRRIRKVLLPGAGGGESGSQPQTAGGSGTAAVPTTVEGDVLVSTLPFRSPDEIEALAFDGGGSSGTSSLILSTWDALYRLPLGDPTAAPTLVVETQRENGAVFEGIVLDGAGNIYANSIDEYDTTSVCRVAADGTVSTVIAVLDDLLIHLAILPNGHLVACGNGPLHVLGLSLQLPAWHAAAASPPPAAPAGPPPRTLAADLRMLLYQQPDGTADVTIVVGGRTFHAHRGLLCARSDYFKPRLGGEFADSRAQQLDLPEADADAFEIILCWVYTDTADIPAALAAGVAELADRLLLPELFQQAVAVVEAGVSPTTVVGLLLWAEARGPSLPGFSELLMRLKAWYLENHEAVLQEAEEEVKRLARCPTLMVELMRGLSSRPAKRPRARDSLPLRARPPAGPPPRAIRPFPPNHTRAATTLVFSRDGLRPLIGADALGGLELGPPLQLYADPADGEPAAARQPYAPVERLTDPVWDPFSSAVYMREGCALLRLSGDDTVTVVAGAVEERGHTDGPGRTARFADPEWSEGLEGGVMADGAGSLYVADGCCIRKVQLPGAGSGECSSQPRTAGGGGVAAVPTTVEGVLVSTLLFRAPCNIEGLAFEGGGSSGSSSGNLVFATCNFCLMDRLPLGYRTAGSTLVPVAQSEDATFKAIVLDGAGTIYAASMENFETTSVRRVAADGSVSTVIAVLDAGLTRLAILPNGHLVACGLGPLHVLGLGLQLPAWHAAAAPVLPAAPTGPPPRTLPTDLRALLDRQPDGTADVAIVVGGCTFHAHRGLLCACSDYFKQLLGGEFVESSAQQLNLPEADADAFGVVLCWVYTGAADIPAALAQAVAELADRLLLPELFKQAAAVVEASVSPGKVAGLLLWAEARGPAFSELLSRIKAWYLENHEAVMQEAEEGMKLLAAQCPTLMVELMRGLSSRPAKHPHAIPHPTGYSFDGVVTRVLPGSRPGEAASTQTLVVGDRKLWPLIGADAHSGLGLGPPLQLYADPAEGQAAARRPYAPVANLTYPVWDPYSSAVYMREGFALLRLSSDDTVTVVAGDVEEGGHTDGPGRTARFADLDELDGWERVVVADGAGSLYVADGRRIRKVQLPGAGGGEPSSQPQTAGGGGAAAVPATVEGDVVVSTLLLDESDGIAGMTFDGGSSSGSSSLVVLMNGTRYRLPLGDPTAEPSLMADMQGGNITGIVLDGGGTIYTSSMDEDDTTVISRVAADGSVSAIIAALHARLFHLAILPNGHLVACGEGPLHVLGLGLQLPAWHAAAAPPPPAASAGPPPCTLPADMRALLDRQPDGTADVIIVVGGRTFHAHRGLLCARCDYFQLRFGPDFTDGSTHQISLPEAEADAFEVVLRWVYTGTADIPAALAQAVAELSDRLLLPELRDQGFAVMEASVSAGTVVGLLVWAEARGPGFSELLMRLKAWYLENHEAVMQEAEEEMKLLAVLCPGLKVELMCGMSSRPVPHPNAFLDGVVTRVLPGGRPGEAASTQTLVSSRGELRPLIGADAHGGLELGPPLQLYMDPAARGSGEPPATRRPYAPMRGTHLADPVWDPYSSAVYMREGDALLRLSGDDTLAVVAGEVAEAGHTDGPGRTARFADLEELDLDGTVVTDGAGSLYVADVCRIRKVQLPGAEGGERSSQPRTAGGVAAVPTTVEGDMLVSTLPFQAPDLIKGLAFDGGGSSGSSSSLVFATARREGAADRHGAVDYIRGIVLDGAGNTYTLHLDDEAVELKTSVRRVAADGTVTSIAEGLDASLTRLAILPNGHLAACGLGPLHVLGLGLQLPAWHAAAAPPPPAAPAGAPPRTLPADLHALLDRQPDGTTDVAIVVGGRTFHAHRGLLCARSDYFQQRLGAGFEESSAQQLTLPEADADAFGVVLCWVYKGAADIPAALAQAVAELADRLLLPELFKQAVAVVEASVSPGTVAGLLLWAEARGPAFSELLSRLKAWYLGNHEAVLQEAEEGMKLLAAQCPGLMAELMRGMSSRPAKRPRAS
ncbi:ARM REPEAT PROTEIN INTERACTING WITH ABF2 [Tetrabaena socialis]|uniref:ARM REPEAT PROTEIN INTERACTING WITH ABF2 n=1 Tax=Tetrabaena socialis TaxID=47790 RepID=A0A2J7ZZN5_9CHLO|nr:ARM REPEAT PROTEIN INTERACTING WITH ABF2 [Tetrabaena socialis]|eukprot:PNH05732.1 ARM REPEAT PROTEIN INTERACTING WITH ABF2 [Tetrabaena socialis]